MQTKKNLMKSLPFLSILILFCSCHGTSLRLPFLSKKKKKNVDQRPIAICTYGKNTTYAFTDSELKEVMKDCPWTHCHFNLDSFVPEDIKHEGFNKTPSKKFYHWCVTQTNNGAELCKITKYFSPPHMIYGTYLLMKDFSEVAHLHNLPFFLEGGTLLAQERFNAPNPWDDDIDLGVMKADLLKVFPKFRHDIEEKGYHLTDACTHADRDKVGICQIYFKEEKFKNMLGTVASNLTSTEKHQLWLNYSTHTKHPNFELPHLDIFTYLQEGNFIVYDSSEWAQDLENRIGQQGYHVDDIFPLTSYQFVDAKTYLPRNLINYTEAWYQTNDIHENVYIWGHRKGGTKIDQVSQSPEVLLYFKQYLQFVFKQKLTFSPTYENLMKNVRSNSQQK